MKKIRDRMILGIVSGVSGNMIKHVINQVAKKKKVSEIDGPARAAGMLIPAHLVSSTNGRIVGYFADSAIASLNGVALVYLLSLTGKNNAILKGAAIGQAGWTVLYGVLGTMGATKVAPASAKTVLSEFVAHTAFGMVAAATATLMGDQSLFNNEIPLTAVGIPNQNKNTSIQERIRSQNREA